MSGQLPFFMSGPRLVIKFDNQIIAFAMGLDISVSRKVDTIYQFGQVSPVANQATLYNGVTGNMQIVKLADTLSRAAKAAIPAKQQYVGSTASSPIGLPTSALDTTPGSVSINKEIQTVNNLDNSSLNYSTTLQSQIDPERVLLSSTFSIEVWQTYPVTVTDNASGTKTGSNGFKTVKHFTIENCRLNSRGTNISPGSITTESVGFVGTLLVSNQRDGGVLDAEDSVASEG